MELDSLRALYVEGLKDLYSAENQIMKALPRMIRAAENPQLKRAFEKHLRVTERQAKRLEKITKALGEKPTGKKCVGMKGLIEEAKELIAEKPEPEVLDAGLLAAAQHVEHYEMAGYGTVRTYARELGYDDQAELLQATLDEEQQTDEELTLLAESSINLEALVAGDDEEEEEERPRRGGGRKKGGAKKGKVRKQSANRARKNLIGA
ncbi:MAG: YciE/YciF ferroxidase family protein [Gemmatimonadaceae bacterium]